ncbi:methionine ABC transporter ATP-binding protein [Bifidobacterium vespertilionis]|uniref:methionine ABC transporter ATP-binding protein n=1 Tax=Bifidobacterium vespertilionis TaxID=2562524 RepID=UPI001BDCF648|nr:methionine ABC transporter ATP-binding protein [Bifidobacterium vespertilionis]MBT1179809.1 methionine ABC transporter ATP-binding protein [Bifidobacterium vespertilionis]
MTTTTEPAVPLLEVSGLSKRFAGASGPVQALSDIALTIDQGDIYGVIGRSGSGKSTLIRCICGLEHFDQGTISFRGQPIDYRDKHQAANIRQQLGIVYQNPLLLHNITVLDNVRLPLHRSGASKSEINDKALRLIDLMGLSGKERSYPNQLSGGQQQRVAIARALMNDPSFLICDEATSALDPETTLSILDLLKQLNQDLGLTILMVTHQMNVVREISNKVSVFEGGRNIETNSTIDLFVKPSTETSQRLIGIDNNRRKLEKIARYERSEGVDGAHGGRPFYLFVFQGPEATEPIISQLSRRFDLDIAILFGDIDLIDNQPYGTLYVSVSGPRDRIAEALDYSGRHGVHVIELKGE